jgi:hypothetical protein
MRKCVTCIQMPKFFYDLIIILAQIALISNFLLDMSTELVEARYIWWYPDTDLIFHRYVQISSSALVCLLYLPPVNYSSFVSIEVEKTVGIDIDVQISIEGIVAEYNSTPDDQEKKEISDYVEEFYRICGVIE